MNFYVRKWNGTRYKMRSVNSQMEFERKLKREIKTILLLTGNVFNIYVAVAFAGL